uniref:Uncharacterized protein n=1 Tax=Kwoniella dejecticola CBS 10117 TaxID=1296121 RepID=A0A1A6AFX8_9TREE|nr:uncharacterized protein I303_00802 [Kwoniella dejecticola CBS 10117]OBR88982.1 hypothetical protein I303_00802 [Kwoniella dejecticola CBS 10117]
MSEQSFYTSSCSSHPCLPALKTEQATALLDFVEFAICDDFIDLARTSLINSLEKQPLELLVVASRRNDLDMAKQALRQIDEVMFNQLFNAPSVHPELAVKEYLRRLTRPYHLAILDAASTQAEDAFGVRVLGSQLIFTNDWSSFADTFSLDQFT